MVTLEEGEGADFTSVTIHRDEWMDRAEKLLKRAKNGERSKRKLGTSSRFFINAPYLYLEYETHLYIKAAEAYRIIGKWLDAAKCYQQAALTQKFIASQNNDDERQPFLNAATLFCQSATYMNRVEYGLGEEDWSKSIVHTIITFLVSFRQNSIMIYF